MPREFTDELLDLVAERLKILAEPMRLKLLNALRSKEKSVTELVEETGTGQANASKHLGLLLRNGMVARRKEGLNVYYRIADPSIFQLCELICNGLEAELDSRRQALEGV
jgi:ArsR family transcriptional regulator